jgi:BCD family chlorophyll transporter-like MFS transporter
VMMGVVGAAIFWFFAVWGEEHSRAVPPHAGGPPSFGTTFGALWGQTHTRRYALFLAASAFFAFMQDAILEPFGGDVFGLSAGETTRFNAFWGSGVLVGMLGTILVTRHRRPDQQVHTTARGLMVLAGALACLSGASLLAVERLVTPTLIMFGLGFGVFTVGGVSLLMAMTTETQAGSYLALWSVIQLVARGAGIAGGGLIRDLAIVLTGQFSTAYAVLFAIEAAGVVISIGLLYRVNISDDSLRTPPEAGEILAAAGE